MTASIPIPFPIGEPIWWVGYGVKKEWVECPECAGTKVLTLIQGNGEKVTIDCACCSRGYEPPHGVIERTVYEHTPTRFIPGRVEISGGVIRYSESGPDAACYRIVRVDELFSDRDECEAACVQLNEDRAKQDAELAVRNLASKRREMAWSVHYWGRKVKELERDLVTARERLQRCKEKQGVAR